MPDFSRRLPERRSANLQSPSARVDVMRSLSRLPALVAGWHRLAWLVAAYLIFVCAAAAQQAQPTTDDIVLGRADAPVTVIEYISLNCPHCKIYHQTVFPELNEKLVATGRVRYVIRDMPLDERGSAAALLARCQPREKYMSALAQIFAESEEWSLSNRPLVALKALASRLGMDGAAFEKCMKNKDLHAAIQQGRRNALKAGITATPTFVVGDRKHVGGATYREIEQLIARRTTTP